MRILDTLAGWFRDPMRGIPSPYIVILGPYHRIHRADEGWVSRVRAIDHALRHLDRVYVNFSVEGKWVIKGGRAAVYSRAPYVSQFNLDPKNIGHRALFASLMECATACYAHNLHLAEHALAWADSGKVITDMHGAVPEEEFLLGHPERAEHFAAIEKDLVTKSRYMVVVSAALEGHLRAKYPQTRCEFIRIPICENLTPVIRNERPGARQRVVYCGSDHAWQNFDAMLDAVQVQSTHLSASFYSHRYKSMRVRADRRTPGHSIRFACVAKAALPAIYAKHDLGFILRDDTIVNRVACPTKLYEYLKCGVIPVVRTPHLGDFEDYGYQFIGEEAFRHAEFPSEAEFDVMRKNNSAAALRLEREYQLGAQRLIYILTKSGAPNENFRLTSQSVE